MPFLTIFFSCSAPLSGKQTSYPCNEPRSNDVYRGNFAFHFSFLIDDVCPWSVTFSLFHYQQPEERAEIDNCKDLSGDLWNLSMIYVLWWALDYTIYEWTVNFACFILKLYILIDIARRRRRNFLITMGKIFMTSRIFHHPSHWNSNYFLLWYWLVAAFLPVGGNPEYFSLLSKPNRGSQNGISN